MSALGPFLTVFLAGSAYVYGIGKNLSSLEEKQKAFEVIMTLQRDQNKEILAELKNLNILVERLRAEQDLLHGGTLGLVRKWEKSGGKIELK